MQQRKNIDITHGASIVVGMPRIAWARERAAASMGVFALCRHDGNGEA